MGATSIQQIADAPLAAVEAAVPDAKAARHLHNACKARVKNPAVSSGSKRACADLLARSKRLKTSPAAGGAADDAAGGGPVSPAEAEADLALPPAVTDDEARLSRTTLLTNRAPLVLAFAVELLRYTMPEQPPSSRLSLAQAVVSANSRSKGEQPLVFFTAPFQTTAASGTFANAGCRSRRHWHRKGRQQRW